MRIALTFPECSRRGGLERFVLETANGLAARGHQVHLLACRWDAKHLDPRVQTHAVRPGFGPAPLPAISFALRSRRLLRALAVDVHGVFGVYCPPGGVFWAGSVHRAWLRISQSQRRFWGRLRQRLNPFHPVICAFERYYIGGHRYRKLIAYTPAMKSDLMEIYGAAPHDIEILGGGFSPTEFNIQRRRDDRQRLRSELGYGPDQKIILFVANELHRKGLGTLLEAMALAGRHSEHLLVVGRASPAGFSLRIEELKLSDRVHFVGPSDDVAGLYAAADLFALPTQYEAWGLVIVEALACGLPVLTSRLAGAAVVVQEGRTGLLLDSPTDAKETAAKIRRLLDGEHADAETIAQSVAQQAWPKILDRYEAILQQCADAPAPGGVMLLTDADVFAGTEQHILTLASALRQKHIDACIGCPQPSPLADRASAAGIPVIAIPKRGLIDWRAAAAIRRLVKSGQIKIVHAHNGRTNLAAAIGLTGLKSGRLVVTQHFLQPAHTKRRGLAGFAGRLLHHWLNRRTDKTIAISQAVADSMHLRQETSADRISVVHNGLSKPAADRVKPGETIRAELAIDPAAPFIVCAARLEPEKDVASLILAMQRLLEDFPAARCVIAGRGSLQESLARQITDLRLGQHVRLLGFHADVISLMAAANVVALPSVAEPFGLVLLEAMSVGRPVVATRAGGPLEIVADGASGLLVPPSDPPALAAALARLIANPAEAEMMGRAARARFEQLFTDEHMADAIADIYRELVQEC